MIDILLSTYNGVQYLPALLDSLFCQTCQEWNLLIRDDGSKDATLKLLNDYSTRYPGRITILPSNGNVGPMRSFGLLAEASKADYMFFCDEDDVWLPEKVQKTLDLMKETELLHPDMPIVVNTDLKVVDKNLNVISDSFWKFSRINPNLFSDSEYVALSPVVTGCTMLINKKTRDLSLPIPKVARMHDAWFVLNAVLKGGVLATLNEPTILYRQHGTNEVGAQNKECNFFVKKLCSLKQVFKDNQKQWYQLKAVGYSHSLPVYVCLKLYYMFNA